MLAETSVLGWLDAVATQTATPGGGSCTALMGATAAALVAMVCRLSLSKGAAGERASRLQQALERAESLRERLTELVSADVAAYEAVMRSYALTRASQAERAQRSAAIQSAMHEATLVPLACAQACGQVLELAQVVSEEGQLSALGESGVAAETAHAALRASALNVSINIGSIHDREFADARRAELEQVQARCGGLIQNIHAIIAQRLGGAHGGPDRVAPKGGHSIGHS